MIEKFLMWSEFIKAVTSDRVTSDKQERIFNLSFKLFSVYRKKLIASLITANEKLKMILARHLPLVTRHCFYSTRADCVSNLLFRLIVDVIHDVLPGAFGRAILVDERNVVRSPVAVRVEESRVFRCSRAVGTHKAELLQNARDKLAIPCDARRLKELVLIVFGHG